MTSLVLAYVQSAYPATLVIQMVVGDRILAAVRPIRPRPLSFLWLAAFRVPLIVAWLYLAHQLLSLLYFRTAVYPAVDWNLVLGAASTSPEDARDYAAVFRGFFMVLTVAYTVEAMLLRLQNTRTAILAYSLQQRQSFLHDGTVDMEGHRARMEAAYPHFQPSMLTNADTKHTWDLLLFSWITFANPNPVTATFLLLLTASHLMLQLLGLWGRRGHSVALFPTTLVGGLQLLHFLATLHWNAESIWFPHKYAYPLILAIIRYPLLVLLVNSTHTHMDPLHIGRTMELSTLFYVVVTFFLYAVMSVVNGTSPVPYAYIRMHLPEWSDHYHNALLKWCYLAWELGNVVGYRFPVNVVRAPKSPWDSRRPWAMLEAGRRQRLVSSSRYNLRTHVPVVKKSPFRRLVRPASQESLEEHPTLVDAIFFLLRWIARIMRWVQRWTANCQQQSVQLSLPVEAAPGRHSVEDESPNEEEEEDEDWQEEESGEEGSDSDSATTSADPRELFEELFYLQQDAKEEEVEEGLTPNSYQTVELIALILARRNLSPSHSSNFRHRDYCVICATEPRQIILLPCQCLVLCDGCREEMAYRRYKECPTCRCEVEGYSRIYTP